MTHGPNNWRAYARALNKCTVSYDGEPVFRDPDEDEDDFELDDEPMEDLKQ